MAPDADQEHVAWSMVHQDQSSVAVVHADGTFAGLIPPHRMIAVLLAEHDEDLARLGGYVAGATRARHAAEEAVGQRLWHRLPWLLIGLVGAMMSAADRRRLRGGARAERPARALRPRRGLHGGRGRHADRDRPDPGASAGVSVRGIARRELISGAIVGLIIAAAFLPFALLGWGDKEVAIAVSLALFAAARSRRSWP